MKRWWLGVLIMVWVSLISLLSYSPATIPAAHADTAYAFDNNGDIACSSGPCSKDTFRAGGGTWNDTHICDQSQKDGPHLTSYAISGLTKDPQGGYNGTI